MVLTGGADGAVLRWGARDGRGGGLHAQAALCRHEAPVLALAPLRASGAGLKGGRRADAALSLAADGGMALWCAADGRCVGACMVLPSVGVPCAAAGLPPAPNREAARPLAAIACRRGDHGVNRAHVDPGCVLVMDVLAMQVLRHLPASVPLQSVVVHAVGSQCVVVAAGQMGSAAAWAASQEALARPAQASAAGGSGGGGSGGSSGGEAQLPPVSEMAVQLPHAGTGSAGWPVVAATPRRHYAPTVMVAPGGGAIVRRSDDRIDVRWARNNAPIASFDAGHARCAAIELLASGYEPPEDACWAGALVLTPPHGAGGGDGGAESAAEGSAVCLLAWLDDGTALLYDLPAELAPGDALIEPASPTGQAQRDALQVPQPNEQPTTDILDLMAMNSSSAVLLSWGPEVGGSPSASDVAMAPRRSVDVAEAPGSPRLLATSEAASEGRIKPRCAVAGALGCSSAVYCHAGDFVARSLSVEAGDDKRSLTVLYCVGANGSLEIASEAALDEAWSSAGVEALDSSPSVISAFSVDAAPDAAHEAATELGWMIACGYDSGRLDVYALPGCGAGATAPIMSVARAHEGRVQCLAASRRLQDSGWERVVVSGGADWRVRAFVASTGEPLACVSPHAGPAVALLPSPPEALAHWSQCVASIGVDGSVAIVSVTGACFDSCDLAAPRPVVTCLPGHPSVPVDGVWDARRGTLACLCMDVSRHSCARSDGIAAEVDTEAAEVAEVEASDIDEGEFDSEVLFVWDIDSATLQRTIRGRSASALLYHMKARARGAAGGAQPVQHGCLRMVATLQGACALSAGVVELVARPVPQQPGGDSWADGRLLFAGIGAEARAALSVAVSGWLAARDGGIEGAPSALRASLCAEVGSGVGAAPLPSACGVVPALEGAAGALTVQFPGSDCLQRNSGAHYAVSRLAAVALGQRLMTLGQSASSCAAALMSLAVGMGDSGGDGAFDISPALQVYAAHWISPSETLRMAARTLFNAAAASANTLEIVTDAVMGVDEQREQAGMVELKVVMAAAATLAAPAQVRAKAASAIAPYLAALVRDEPSAAAAAAADILADGIELWQKHLTPRQMAALVVDAFNLSAKLQSVGLRSGRSDPSGDLGGGLTAYDAAAAREATANLLAALLRADAPLVLRRIKWQLENAPPVSTAHSTAIVAVTHAVSARPEALRPHLALLGTVLHQAMQPANDALRKSCLPRCMALCRTLAASYTEVAFHEQSMRLALADTMPSAASVVDSDDAQVAVAVAAAEAAAAAAPGGGRPAALAFDLQGAARAWRFERSPNARAGAPAVRAALAARARGVAGAGAGVKRRAEIYLLSFSPDGRHLACLSSRDSALRVWPLGRVGGEGASAFGTALSALGATALGAAVGGGVQSDASSVGLERCAEVPELPLDCGAKQVVFEWARGGSVTVRRAVNLSVLAAV